MGSLLLRRDRTDENSRRSSAERERREFDPNGSLRCARTTPKSILKNARRLGDNSIEPIMLTILGEVGVEIDAARSKFGIRNLDAWKKNCSRQTHWGRW